MSNVADQATLRRNDNALKSGDRSEIDDRDTEVGSKVSILSSIASDWYITEGIFEKEGGQETDPKKLLLGSATRTKIDLDEVRINTIGAIPRGIPDNEILSGLFSAPSKSIYHEVVGANSPREVPHEPPGCCNVGHHWGCYMACCFP